VPRPRIKLTLEAAAAGPLDQAQADAAARMPPPAAWFDRPFLWVRAVDPAGRQHLVFDGRLRQRAVADQLWTDLQALAAGWRAAGLAGRLSYHQCRHDDPVVTNCRDHPAAQYQEVVL
jgi:hypothetical protein